VTESNRSRVAIVVGGAGGLGRAIARQLVGKNTTVVVADVAGDAAEAVCAELNEAGHLAVAIGVDVTSNESVTGLIRASAELGPVAILVNSAGFPVDRPLVKMTDRDWRTVLDVCLYGTFATCRAVVPLMMEAQYGRIVNISSRAHLGNPGQANYSAAKAGVIGLTKAIAKEVGRYSITCNAVAPGMIDTPLIRAHPKFDMIAERAVAENAIKRLGESDDVAAAVAYLTSPQAGFVTGEVVHVSGGRFG